MSRLLRSAVLAAILAVVAAPVTLADSAGWRDRTMDCGSAGTMTFLLPPSEFSTAFVPFHDKAGTAVLVPYRVSVDGDVYLDKPAAAKRVGLITCSYVDPQGWSVKITGLLTPGS